MNTISNIYLFAPADDFDQLNMRSKVFSRNSIMRNEFFLGSTTTSMCFIMYPALPYLSPRECKHWSWPKYIIPHMRPYWPQVEGLLHYPINRYSHRHINRVYHDSNRDSVLSLDKLVTQPDSKTRTPLEIRKKARSLKSLLMVNWKASKPSLGFRFHE